VDSTEPVTTAIGLTRLGFLTGQVVQEFGYDGDVDNDLRFAVEDLCGSDLEDEDYADVADAALIWWRTGDGDLVDLLTDALPNLVERGFIVLLTPRAGRDGEVEPSDVEEAAVTAGLHTSGSVNVSTDWSATRLVSPKSARR
jgi:hypothetical protein